LKIRHICLTSLKCGEFLLYGGGNLKISILTKTRVEIAKHGRYNLVSFLGA
jgi:hypothetical protein